METISEKLNYLKLNELKTGIVLDTDTLLHKCS